MYVCMYIHIYIYIYIYIYTVAPRYNAVIGVHEVEPRCKRANVLVARCMRDF